MMRPEEWLAVSDEYRIGFRAGESNAMNAAYDAGWKQAHEDFGNTYLAAVYRLHTALVEFETALALTLLPFGRKARSIRRKVAHEAWLEGVRVGHYCLGGEDEEQCPHKSPHEEEK